MKAQLFFPLFWHMCPYTQSHPTFSDESVCKVSVLWLWIRKHTNCRTDTSMVSLLCTSFSSFLKNSCSLGEDYTWKFWEKGAQRIWFYLQLVCQAKEGLMRPSSPVKQACNQDSRPRCKPAVTSCSSVWSCPAYLPQGLASVVGLSIWVWIIIPNLGW